MSLMRSRAFSSSSTEYIVVVINRTDDGACGRRVGALVSRALFVAEVPLPDVYRSLELMCFAQIETL